MLMLSSGARIGASSGRSMLQLTPHQERICDVATLLLSQHVVGAYLLELCAVRASIHFIAK
jgi:hypothetical protein